ncbi:hypothetical protein [Edaphobacter aggregans]|uniref:hypothetical protein n=1 Tax=Edaphobacter aggregans TaxID=570835 RepID=UPI00163957A2|nr:hypothetical protein [Edaphobacter aggregans]
MTISQQRNILGPAYFHKIAAILKTAAESGAPTNPAALAEVTRCHGLTPAPS